MTARNFLNGCIAERRQGRSYPKTTQYFVRMSQSNPIASLDRSIGFQEVEAPRF
jgi:hypothetical protein